MRLIVLLSCCAIALAYRDGQCDIARNFDRIDCYPEWGSSEQGCVNRGCCWGAPRGSDSYFPPLNVPYCYYPKGFDGYKVVNQSQTSSGATIFLQRGVPSQIAQSPDVKLLRVDVIQQNNNILRVRIVDANSARWEPPLPKPPAPADEIVPNYVFQLTGDSKLQVQRFDGDKPTVTLASFDLGSLVYTDRFLQLTSDLPSDVLYGLGEHKGTLRRSVDFKRFSFYNQDRPPGYDARLYGTHPMYINIEQDGRANGVWLFNSNAMDVILQPKPAITFRPVGGIFDFFVFVGPTPADVIYQYQQMVGLPKMVPYWSLGFHLCRFGYKSTDDTRQVFQKNVDAGIRIDVQWNDIDYMDERNGFTLDPVHYKDLGVFVKELHDSGRHYVVIVDPAVSGSENAGSYPPFDRGLDYNVFVKDVNGKVVYARVWNLKSSVFPDFTHPNATAYWTELFTNFHKEVPIDGAWIDMNEPANMLNGHLDEGCPGDYWIPYTPGDEDLRTKTLCMSDQHHWSSHYNVHNMYGFTEAISTYDALEAARPNQRPFIISRSTFSGHGYYAGHWTGDVFSTWTDLRDSVPGFLEFSFYGVPMVGVDICGFNGNSNPDLCARWQAVGAFYPFSRNHNSDDTIAQDPVSMGDKVVTVTKNAYYWRYKFLPYLYTLFHRANQFGETVARPLFFDNPSDTSTYDIDEQFFWGKALMVVPALHENQQTIKAYFPKGVWYDLQNRTGTVDASSGGKFVNVKAYEDTINFFMKGGNAVFFQEPGMTTTESLKNPYGLYVFLDDDVATGELYIDDGDSIDAVETGKYERITAVGNTKMLVIGHDSGMHMNKMLDRVHIYGIQSKPHRVTVDLVDFGDFTYDDKAKLLTLYNLNRTLDFVTAQFYY